MIQLIMNIKDIGSFHVCNILSSFDNIEEIRQAIVCEHNYNCSELDFGGFKYDN